MQFPGEGMAEALTLSSASPMLSFWPGSPAAPLGRFGSGQSEALQKFPSPWIFHRRTQTLCERLHLLAETLCAKGTLVPHPPSEALSITVSSTSRLDVPGVDSSISPHMRGLPLLLRS